MKRKIDKEYLKWGLLLPLCLILSCKRDALDPYFGPQSCPGEDFHIISEFQMNKYGEEIVNFRTTDSLYFTASFSAPARWKIVIEGNSSRASKTFEGLSSEIRKAWYGRSGKELFFMDETVTVRFLIVCRPELSQEYSVHILKPDFVHDPEVVVLTRYNGPDGIYPDGTSFYAAQDAVYGDAVLDSIWCPYSPKCEEYRPSQEGGGYLTFKGISPIPGGLDKNTYGSQEMYFNLMHRSLPSDPSQVWFNFLANSGGTPAKIVLTFGNGDNGDRYGRKVISIKTSEWTMYSICLGTLDKMEGDLDVFDTKELNLLAYTLVQSEGIAPTLFHVDLPCFTKGSSFYGMTE